MQLAELVGRSPRLLAERTSCGRSATRRGRDDRGLLERLYDARDALLVYYDELPGDDKADIWAMLAAALIVSI